MILIPVTKHGSDRVMLVDRAMSASHFKLGKDFAEFMEDCCSPSFRDGLEAGLRELDERRELLKGREATRRMLEHAKDLEEQRLGQQPGARGGRRAFPGFELDSELDNG